MTFVAGSTQTVETIGKVGRKYYFSSNSKTDAIGTSSTATYSRVAGSKTVNFWCYGTKIAAKDPSPDTSGATTGQGGWIGCATCDIGQRFEIT